MFTQAEGANRRWNRSLLVSFVLHAVLIYFFVRPPKPIYVTPSQVAFGHGGTSTTTLIYFAQHGAAQADASAAKPETTRLSVPSPAHSRPQPRPKPAAVEEQQQQRATVEQPARAGTPYGSLMQGAFTGHDVRPALPIEYPNPAILPWQIPSGVEGTVIVEVTIDALGNVIETRVLKGLGHGIEDKVVAALRNWRFRPAMMDGRAIPSQQDVYFHFPS